MYLKLAGSIKLTAPNNTADDRESLSRGGGLAHYDALLLHADQDIEFVKIMLSKLEDEYGMKVSVHAGVYCRSGPSDLRLR